MNALSYKTISANSTTVNKNWILIDAENETLGRLASKVAILIRGKHKTNFTPHVDCGDYVIVINADKITLTGNKWEDKEYISYTGYPGGQKTTNPARLMAKKPTYMIEHAIKGMLPKNKIGSEMFRNLCVYAGAEHPHEAQKPKQLKLTEIK